MGALADVPAGFEYMKVIELHESKASQLTFCSKERFPAKSFTMNIEGLRRYVPDHKSYILDNTYVSFAAVAFPRQVLSTGAYSVNKVLPTHEQENENVSLYSRLLHVILFARNVKAQLLANLC